MTVKLTLFGAVALFIVAAVALWRTVGGLVDQAGVRAAEPASIDVHFRLTDYDDTPLSNAPVRLVFGNDPWRQTPSAGRRFTTDANGEYRGTITAPIDRVQKKIPTHFIDSLFSRPKPADHLSLGAELGYMTFRWLYVVDLYRFADGGGVLFDGLSVYTRDDHGSYARRANFDGTAWRMDDLGEMRLTTPGNEIWDFALDRKEGTRDQWTLSLAFKRFPDPVVR